MASPKQSSEEIKANVVHDAKAGKYQATIFKNVRTGKNGQFDSYNVQLRKSWLKAGGDPKNKDDWDSQSMSLFNAQEVRQAIIVLEEMEKHLLIREKE